MHAVTNIYFVRGICGRPACTHRYGIELELKTIFEFGVGSGNNMTFVT